MSSFDDPIVAFKKHVVSIPMSAEFIFENTGTFNEAGQQIWRAVDKSTRPWLYNDRNPFPVLEPFDLVVRARRAAQTCDAIRSRAVDAWAVLRGHASIHDGGYDW